MRRIFTITLALVFFAGSVVSAQNTDKAAEYMRRLAAKMESMRSYTVEFRAEAGGESVRGRYEVAGSRYYIAVAGNEVYGDDSIRREIDATRREIVVDVADTASRNLLTNPTRGFRFLGDDFHPNIESESDGCAVVTLTPRHKDFAGKITVAMSASDAMPIQVQYYAEGESITIFIESIAEGAAVPSFDAARYPGFETIDFR